VKDLDDFDKVDYKMYLDTLDIRKSNEYYNRVVCVEYCSVFLAFFGASLCIIQNELSMEFDLSETFHYIMFSYIALTTLLLAFSIYQRYEIYLAWCVSRNLLTEYDNLISTGWWRKLSLELVIILMAPYPFLMGLQYHEDNTNWNITVTYEINQILMCFSFCRVYLLLRFTLINSKFNNPRSHRICIMNGCEADEMFAIKSLMKQAPF
jgi:hypothetical protein